ncbi:hypothetical protein D9615_002418 [Tricholomella constricta]|uniref:Pheromone receptor n=1 Tax=Tricholomella constricta TaxID=117010 RepID=A0A8H5HMF6_9AGAR|nr:hypothetical protein D9615_002418 [Tricholomella constricta]
MPTISSFYILPRIQGLMTGNVTRFVYIVTHPNLFPVHPPQTHRPPSKVALSDEHQAALLFLPGLRALITISAEFLKTNILYEASGLSICTRLLIMSAITTIFSVVSFITFILVAIPFSWHLEAWNTGTCLYMAWSSLGCLNLFINSVVWRENMANVAPVWCDISTKFIFGVTVALPAASLCINRRLYQIASIQAVTMTRADKRKGVLVDLSIGVGLPVLFMILHYIVQGHRFDIFEDYGCMPFSYNTPITYVIVHGPILTLGIVSAVYASLSIIKLKRRKVELQTLLSSHPSLNASRYLRLMCLASTEIALSVPLALVAIVISSQGDVQPWISWEDVHFGFSWVERYPAVVWRATSTSNLGLERTRWGTVVCGLIFFAFFGFAEEAMDHYRFAYRAVGRWLGVRTWPVENLDGGYAGSMQFQDVGEFLWETTTAIGMRVNRAP